MSVSAQLSRRILHANRNGKPLAELEISEMEARSLARELAGITLMAGDPSEAEIFDGMVCGRSKFMDVPIKVASATA